FQRSALHIPHDAHYCAPGTSHLDLLSYWIGFTKVIRKLFVNNDHTRLSIIVGRLENSPSQNGDPHGGEVSRSHPATFPLGFIPRNNGRLSLYFKAAHVLSSIQRQVGNRSHSAHPAKSLQTVEQLRKKRNLTGLISVFRARHLQIERQHRIGSETWLHCLDAEETSYPQAGQRQHDEGECHLRRDQPAACVPSNCTIDAAAAFMERFTQVYP